MNFETIEMWLPEGTIFLNHNRGDQEMSQRIPFNISTVTIELLKGMFSKQLEIHMIIDISIRFRKIYFFVIT